MSKAAIYYKAPILRPIGRSDDSEKLYRLEEKRDQAVRAATEELHALLLKHDIVSGLAKNASVYFGYILPESLMNLLEAQDRRAALMACLSFIAHYANPDQPESPNREMVREVLAGWSEQQGREFTALLPTVTP